MSCPSQTAVLWAEGELAQDWMTFVTRILVSSLGGAMAPVAQAGAERTDVIWGLWEVYDHDAPIWEYLLGRYCAANGVSVGHECVYARDGDGFLIINT